MTTSDILPPSGPGISGDATVPPFGSSDCPSHTSIKILDTMDEHFERTQKLTDSIKTDPPIKLFQLSMIWKNAAREFTDEVGDEVSMKATVNRAYAQCLKTCAEQLREFLRKILIREPAHLALISAAFDEEFQRMGAVRGPLYRAVAAIRDEVKLTPEQVEDVLEWLAEEQPEAFGAAQSGNRITCRKG